MTIFKFVDVGIWDIIIVQTVLTHTQETGQLGLTPGSWAEKWPDHSK